MQKPDKVRYNKAFFNPGDTHVLYDNLKDDKECNLYIVSTPGQLLSAIEAQHHFKTKNNILVILFFVVGDGKNINHMFELAKYFPYDKLITYQNATKKSYKAFSNYLNILNTKEYNYMFVGYDSMLYRRMIVNTVYKELHFIDSGSHLINVHKQSCGLNPQDKKYKIESFKQLSNKGKVTEIQFKLRGYQRDGVIKDPNFFTVFNLIPYKNEKIVQHNYNYIKEIFSSDINLYKSQLLNIYTSTLAGHKETYIQNKIRDLAGKKTYLHSSTGIDLDISFKYPISRLQIAIEKQEKQLLTMKTVSDRDVLNQLQLSLVLKEDILFEETINTMIFTYIKRMQAIEQSQQTLNSHKRIIGLISTSTEALKLLVVGQERFENKITTQKFYELFGLLSFYAQNNTLLFKEKVVLSKKLSLLYGYFFGTLYIKKSIQESENYFHTNIKVFTIKKVDTLTLMIKVQKKTTSNFIKSAKMIFDDFLDKKSYMHTHTMFYSLLTLGTVLKRDISELIQYFTKINFKVQYTDKHIDALEIMIKESKYRKIIRNRAFDIFNRGSYTRENRIHAGLVAAESYILQENKAQAIKYYFLVWNRFGCNSRVEALKYLHALEVLELQDSQKEMYQNLYVKYIFGPFTDTHNSDIVIDFLSFYTTTKETKNNNSLYTRPYVFKHDKAFFKPGDTHVLYDNLQDDKECNLYLVSTPGQLLSAIEAQHHFKTKNNILVILFFVIGDGKNINHMFELSKYFPYDKLITYQNKSAKFYISFIPFLKLLKNSEYNYVFFGFNTILYRRMVANLRKTNLYYLDDGVHTITTHEMVYGDTKPNPEYKPFPKTLNLLKMMYVYGGKNLKVDNSLQELNFFTVYNLQKYKNENILKHSYTHVRSLFHLSEVQSRVVYVLGQPLVNIGFTQEAYDTYLNNIFEYYKNREILFCPHRLEKMSSEIQEKIKTAEQIRLLDPGMPIELYFLKNSIYPFATVSFITSALFNIKKLFPQTITQAFKIDTSGLEQFHIEGIEKIYSHYTKEMIEIVPIQNKESN